MHVLPQSLRRDQPDRRGVMRGCSAYINATCQQCLRAYASSCSLCTVRPDALKKALRGTRDISNLGELDLGVSEQSKELRRQVCMTALPLSRAACTQAPRVFDFGAACQATDLSDGPRPWVLLLSQTLDLQAGCSFRYYVTGPVPSVHRLPEIFRPKLSVGSQKPSLLEM